MLNMPEAPVKTGKAHMLHYLEFYPSMQKIIVCFSRAQRGCRVVLRVMLQQQ